MARSPKLIKEAVRALDAGKELDPLTCSQFNLYSLICQRYERVKTFAKVEGFGTGNTICEFVGGRSCNIGILLLEEYFYPFGWGLDKAFNQPPKELVNYMKKRINWRLK